MSFTVERAWCLPLVDLRAVLNGCTKRCLYPALGLARHKCHTVSLFCYPVTRASMPGMSRFTVNAKFPANCVSPRVIRAVLVCEH